jgi:hypothetical protein
VVWNVRSEVSLERPQGLRRLMTASGQTRSFGDIGSVSGLPESRHEADRASRPVCTGHLLGSTRGPIASLAR